MSTQDQGEWRVANQAYLTAALREIQARLEERADSSRAPDGEQPEEIAARMSEPPALERLAQSFGLSPFERDVLLLCAGVELDSRFRAVCRDADGGRGTPTFSLALAALPEAHWSALTPSAPLRYWRLVEVGPGEGPVKCPLRIDERVLHYLAGVSYQDERVQALAQPWPPPCDLPTSQSTIAYRIGELWRRDNDGMTPVQLCGDDTTSVADVAARACALAGFELQVLQAQDIALAAAEREQLLRLWDREAVLGGTATLVFVEDGTPAESLRAAAAFVERAQSPVLVGGREPLPLRARVLPRFDVHTPDNPEQEDLWRRALGPLADQLDGQVGELVNQFNMGPAAIATASRSVVRSHETDARSAAAALWDTCRGQSRARLDDLAQRIETHAAWDDLVLPPLSKQILGEILVHVRHRTKVYDQWGFAAKNRRGLGISALFFGDSGTGKTMAAEILASELQLDLYRIDLSQVVSKYIGETEKNLRRVFDAAESAGAVLLFDEADALFGTRSEVKDSHDRYANIEVSYLLQRMEVYRGLAILTTNMKQALDPAFTRRIRFLAHFPFPDEEQRAEIWRRIFPAETPTEALEPEQLARLNVAGGNIRNIALGAAFLAADEDRPVSFSHVLRAARAEYAKLDRSLTETEIAGWRVS